MFNSGPPPHSKSFKQTRQDVKSCQWQTHSTSNVASKYRTRDTHEEFCRPVSGHSRKYTRAYNTRSKKKPRPLTDKERRAAALEHWELNHDMPEILGHFDQDHQQHTDLANGTMAPIQMTSLMGYIDYLSLHHENLKNLDDSLPRCPQLQFSQTSCHCFSTLSVF